MKFLILSLALALSVNAWAGTETNSGNGGNSLASHFTGVAKRTGKALRLICGNPETATSTCELLPKFLDAIAGAEVVPGEHLNGPDGKRREATNDGKSRIVIDVRAYEKLGIEKQAERIVRLVIHEYLGIAGTEQSDRYVRSEALMALLKENSIALPTLVGPMPRLLTANQRTFVGRYQVYASGEDEVDCNEAATAAEGSAQSRCWGAGFTSCRKTHARVVESFAFGSTGWCTVEVTVLGTK